MKNLKTLAVFFVLLSLFSVSPIFATGNGETNLFGDMYLDLGGGIQIKVSFFPNGEETFIVFRGQEQVSKPGILWPKVTREVSLCLTPAEAIKQDGEWLRLVIEETGGDKGHGAPMVTLAVDVQGGCTDKDVSVTATCTTGEYQKHASSKEYFQLEGMLTNPAPVDLLVRAGRVLFNHFQAGERETPPILDDMEKKALVALFNMSIRDILRERNGDGN